MHCVFLCWRQKGPYGMCVTSAYWRWHGMHWKESVVGDVLGATGSERVGTYRRYWTSPSSNVDLFRVHWFYVKRAPHYVYNYQRIEAGEWCIENRLSSAPILVRDILNAFVQVCHVEPFVPRTWKECNRWVCVWFQILMSSPTSTVSNARSAFAPACDV